MKKVLLLALMLVGAFTLVGCDKEDNNEQEETVKTFLGDETLSMANIDEYLEYEDAQFIDLRNFEDKFKDGYISGFENISFFQYLDNNAFTRNGDMTFSSDEITNETILRNFFDEDKAIVLMCGSGTRANYVKEALVELGYTKVFNAGGMSDYDGENKVLGDGSYELPTVLPDNVIPFTHVTPKGESEKMAYILHEVELIDEVRYQFAYIACVCRGAVQKYYSVAYLIIDTDTGVVKEVSFDLDTEGEYQAGLFGDSILTEAGIENWNLFQGFLQDEIIDATPESIHAITPYAGGDVDAYTGASVTPDNFVRALQALLDYHEAKYMD